MNSNEPLVVMSQVTKAFSGVQVLKNGRIEIRRGEIHALMGANGAGKSTLMKILVGVHARDSGELLVRNASGDLVAAEISDPRSAHEHGIAIVHQELILMEDMSISDNVSLGHEAMKAGALIDDRSAKGHATRALARVGLDLDPRRTVRSLSAAQKQLVEIARAIASDAKVLILDEPTTSLSAGETKNLLEVLDGLRSGGLAIVYISHRMDEVFSLSERITVMRDGEFVEEVSTSSIDRPGLVRRMIGRELQNYQRAAEEQAEAGADGESGQPALEVAGISNSRISDVSLTIHPGEIVGLFGLVGAGRTELARAIFGVDDYDAGEVRIFGKTLPKGSAQAARAAGIGFAPEERKQAGLVLGLPIIRNMEMARLPDVSVLRSKRSDERSLWERYRERLGIVARGPQQETRTLSGGNQQKIVLAKWLAVKPKVLILDEPTKGIDIAAKQDIYELIRELARDGMAVLVISSESEEIHMLSDRVMVMREGAVTHDGPNQGLDDQTLLQYAMGVA